MGALSDASDNAELNGVEGVALYDFEATSGTELSLRQGDNVYVFARTGEWWFGDVDDRSGYATQFVQSIRCFFVLSKLTYTQCFGSATSLRALCASMAIQVLHPPRSLRLTPLPVWYVVLGWAACPS